MVLAARHGESSGQNALTQLCQEYWYPLYVFVRRRGFDSHDAEDLTQEFFARLIGKKSLQSVHPEKGKFRSFLLASLKNFLANEWGRGQRQKRGGGQRLLSLDEERAENRYQSEPADQSTPETVYERAWASTLLDLVLARLRREYAENEKADLFDEIKGFLSGDKGSSTYAQIGARHGVGESAVKMTVLRLRKRYGALLRAEIANTVDTPEEIEREIRHLFTVLTK